MITDQELDDIEKRDHATRNHPPKVRLSYEERLINRLPETDLYIRNTKATRNLDFIAQGQRIFEQLKPIFEPAYAAERDRARLIAEIRELRAIAEAAKEREDAWKKEEGSVMVSPRDYLNIARADQKLKKAIESYFAPPASKEQPK